MENTLIRMCPLLFAARRDETRHCFLVCSCEAAGTESQTDCGGYVLRGKSACLRLGVSANRLIEK